MSKRMRFGKKWVYKEIHEVKASCVKNISSKLLGKDAEDSYLLWNAGGFFFLCLEIF